MGTKFLTGWDMDVGLIFKGGFKAFLASQNPLSAHFQVEVDGRLPRRDE
jgi:hypothetical protein